MSVSRAALPCLGGALLALTGRRWGARFGHENQFHDAGRDGLPVLVACIPELAHISVCYPQRMANNFIGQVQNR